MTNTPIIHDDMDQHNDDDVAVNPTTTAALGDLLDQRVERRSVLKGLSLGAAAAGVGASMTSKTALAAGAPKSTTTFKEVPQVLDSMHHVAEGYDTQVLIRWGDAVAKDAPAFDPMNLTTDAQLKQFGYNCDFIGFQSLPKGSDASDHGLLCVNHEYTNRQLMWDGAGADKNTQSKDQIDYEMAAHGHTIIEVKRENGAWDVVEGSKYARRITTLETEMELSGPVAGHERVKTSVDPEGKTVIGTLNNCAGGETPWGTVLIGEENFHGYFGGDPAKTAEGENYKRYGMKGKPWYGWYRYHDRFDVEKEANEANRFGWVVEIDPYDPTSKPKKRTALGRFKHEGANVVVNKDGHVVAYSGDDQRFEYLYKFVSKNKFNARNRDANKDILDEGTLYVAQFRADGNLFWQPLVFGQGPLTKANGFNSQADVLIETRRAADLLGATPMDRPEDVEPNLVTGSVFIMLTNNTKRKEGQENAANPRASNKNGHIVEITPPGGKGKMADHTSDVFKWNIFLLAGNNTKPEDASMYGEGTTENGWLGSPDNVAFDNKGRVWIATDGAPKAGVADGLWAADAEGPARAQTRRFFAAPVGAEVCGPCFTPDDSTLFVAIQHPGDTKGSTFANPSTRWPDFDKKLPPRPSVVAITKRGGGSIG